MTIGAAAPSGRLTAAQRGAFVGALIGWVFDYYEVFLLTVLSVPIAAEFKLTTAQVGLVFSIQLLFLAIGGVVFGFLADRIGRKKVLMLTIVIFSLGTMVRAAAPNYESLLVLTAIAALGIGGEYGVGQTLVTETIDRRSRGFYSAFLYGGIYVGIALGALVGGFVAPSIGWRLTFLVSGLPALLALWVRRHTPESRIWLERSDIPLASAESGLSLHLIAVWLLCVLAASLQFFAYYGVASFLPTYLVSKGATLPRASSWLIFTAVAGAVGCAAGALLSDRIGRRPTLSILAGTAGIGGVWLAVSWDDLLSGGAGVLVPFFILFAGSNGAAVFGALFSESFPASVRATGVSSALQVGRGLSFFPPLIAAALLPTFGYQPIVFVSAGLFGVLAVVAWLFRETSGTDLAAGTPTNPRATAPVAAGQDIPAPGTIAS